MSEQQNFGFGKFVPGFDFLQNLGKGAAQSQAPLPNLTNWVAPTLNVDELEKRIGELKAVHFWLDQNSKALGATIQALELQKMTLATLKGMNFNMADIANALKLKPSPGQPDAAAQADKPRGASWDETTGSVADAAKKAVAKARAGKNKSESGAAVGAAAGVVDPMQWWGALTQQFQEIAASAMKEVSKDPGPGPGAAAASAAPGPRPAPKGAGTAGKTAARKVAAPARKQARKSAARGR
jgi:hypothetical protein